MLQVMDVAYRTILHQIDAAWTTGMVGVIGPNGAGKSTLLKLLAGIDRPDAGDIRLDDTSIYRLTTRERSQHMAYLPQQLPDDIVFTVQEFVEMGRYPHRRPSGSLTPQCKETVSLVLHRMNLQGLASVPVGQLSGGERQRVAIARCLAQESRVLILDEPISNLDLFYQINILKLLSELTTEGYLVILAIHHLELAAQYCDELLLLNDGKIHCSGAVDTVMQPSILREVFHMNVRVFTDPYDASLRLSFGVQP